MDSTKGDSVEMNNYMFSKDRFLKNRIFLKAFNRAFAFIENFPDKS